MGIFCNVKHIFHEINIFNHDHNKILEELIFRSGPRFLLVLWNHTIDALLTVPKTTNAVEGYHNALNSIFTGSHPTIWKFFEGIKKDINVHRYTYMQSVVENNVPPRSKYKLIAERLSARVASYGQEPDKMLYLRSIAHIVSS